MTYLTGPWLGVSLIDLSPAQGLSPILFLDGHAAGPANLPTDFHQSTLAKPRHPAGQQIQRMEAVAKASAASATDATGRAGGARSMDKEWSARTLPALRPVRPQPRRRTSRSARRRHPRHRERAGELPIRHPLPDIDPTNSSISPGGVALKLTGRHARNLEIAAPPACPSGFQRQVRCSGSVFLNLRPLY